ncbi:MAG: c-type cytochrome domain-containing protein, partial [Myxococcota bacterium]
GEGNTLYYFASDVPGSDASACEGGCANNWPAFYVENLEAGNGLNADAFDSFERADGRMQTTYRGYPLYTFANDNAPGDTNGEGAGNTWYTIAVPFYDAVILNTTNQDIGLYLAIGDGSTLYVFANDTPAGDGQDPISACEGGCLNTWPAFHVPVDTLKTVSTIDIADFGEYQRGDGQMQTTYRGYPLYTFANDNAPGDTNGEGIGDTWFTLDPLTFEGFDPPQTGVEASEVQAILDARCTGCHTNGGRSGGLNFDDFEAAMINVQARPGLDYIEPGDSDGSFLIQKLEGTQGAGNGSRMPIGGVMPPEDIALIRDFIDNTL